MRSRNALTGLDSECLMKAQSCFEIRVYIKGRVNLNILGSQTHNEFWQIQRPSAVFKTLVFRWNKK